MLILFAHMAAAEQAVQATTGLADLPAATLDDIAAAAQAFAVYLIDQLVPIVRSLEDHPGLVLLWFVLLAILINRAWKAAGGR